MVVKKFRLDPLTWMRLIDESGISTRDKAYLYKSRVFVSAECVEVQVLSPFHRQQAVGTGTTEALVSRLLQGIEDIRITSIDDEIRP